jgi:hypothetical protein
MINLLTIVYVKCEAKQTILTLRTDTFNLDLVLDKGKADGGVRVMFGSKGARLWTKYYSCTNMPTSGKVILRDTNGMNRDLQVTGEL